MNVNSFDVVAHRGSLHFLEIFLPLYSSGWIISIDVSSSSLALFVIDI